MESVNVLFWSGQSNAQNKDSFAATFPSLVGQTLNTYAFNTTTFEQITYGTNQTTNSDYWNLETSVAPQLLTLYSKPVYCFKQYISGSPLGILNNNLVSTYHPYSATNNHYSILVSSISQAFVQLRLNSKTVDKIFFVWIQGESDATVGYNLSALYQDNLRLLVRAMQTCLKVPVTIVIVGINYQHPNLLVDGPIVRAAQQAIAAEFAPAVKYVETLGLPLIDTVHYTPAGYKTVGERIVTAITT